MTEFRIHSDGVATLGSRAEQLAADLENALSLANREVSGLASSWTGEAGAAYLRGWEEMHDGGLRIFTALRSLAGSLGVTSAEFDGRDQSTSSSILSLT
ncbi:WXG100 family type VII secretion target [Smaragdicoccus niigatensis]|uniref:WXG100 family type VII secretion target n=1 Tax=Smaragdicoccus niigatensis TaxID=359359 RepID=UPI00035EF706|nr:WXG100 family type VII secretion target [Smaragdicoccus niigatensis]